MAKDLIFKTDGTFDFGDSKSLSTRFNLAELKMGGRVAFANGSPFARGTRKTAKLTNAEVKAIKALLPKGMFINLDGNRWRLVAEIQKGGERNRTSITNPTLKQAKELIKTYKANYKKTFPGSLNNEEFKKLRLSSKYKDLTAVEFTDVLEDLNKKSVKTGKDFTVGNVQNIQSDLGIGNQVGEKATKLTLSDQNKLKNAFPQYKKWDFDNYRYGLDRSKVGPEAYSALRHTLDDKKAWPSRGDGKVKLWHNAYRSALKGGDGRFKLYHPKTNKIMTPREIRNYDWTKASAEAEFLDTKTGKKFNFNNFEKWMNTHAEPGKPDSKRFDKAVDKYDLTSKLKQTQLGEQNLGQLLNEKYKASSKNVRFSGLVNHHMYDIADNFWDTDIVSFQDNAKLNTSGEKEARKILKDTSLSEGEKNKKFKTFANKMNNIQMKEGSTTLGKYSPEKLIKDLKNKLKLTNSQANTLLNTLDSNQQMVLSNKIKTSGIKDLSKIGKAFKVLGVAAAPLEVLPFAQQMEKGMGVRSLDTGAARFVEDLFNMPKMLANLVGKDLPYEERTFGRKYADKVAREMGEEKITENIDQMFKGSEKVNDPMYDALGEYSFSARTDDRDQAIEKALTPFFATGGRVGYKDGTPKEETQEDIIASFMNNPYGFEDKSKLGRAGDVLDVRNIPYYASKTVRGGLEGLEFAARLPFTAGKLVGDLLKGPPTKTMFAEAWDNTLPAWGWSNKLGLDSLIQEQEDGMKRRGSSTAPIGAGGIMELGGDLAAPLAPLGAIKSMKRLYNQGTDILDFVSSQKGMNTNVIDEALTAKGMGRRDFNKIVATSGLMVALKVAGLSDMFKLTPIKPTGVGLKVLKESSTNMPVWFPQFVDKISAKMIYEGDGISKYVGTADELPGVEVTKNGENWTVAGKNEYGQDFELRYEAPGYIDAGAEGGSPVFYKGDFTANDTVPSGYVGPEDVDWDPSLLTEVDEVLGGTRQLEEFATGKKVTTPTVGEEAVTRAELKADHDYDRWQEQQADDFYDE